MGMITVFLREWWVIFFLNFPIYNFYLLDFIVLPTIVYAHFECHAFCKRTATDELSHEPQFIWVHWNSDIMWSCWISNLPTQEFNVLPSHPIDATNGTSLDEQPPPLNKQPPPSLDRQSPPSFDRWASSSLNKWPPLTENSPLPWWMASSWRMVGSADNLDGWPSPLEEQWAPPSTNALPDNLDEQAPPSLNERWPPPSLNQWAPRAHALTPVPWVLVLDPSMVVLQRLTLKPRSIIAQQRLRRSMMMVIVPKPLSMKAQHAKSFLKQEVSTIYWSSQRVPF